MDAIETLLSWAETQGITVSNVGPRVLPGRGIGIVATSPIKKDDTILDVPIPCLKTISTIPKPLTRPFPKDTAVHALLALDIALDDAPPSRPALTSLLPPAASSLLAAQREKFESHWSLVSAAALPGGAAVGYEDYRHAWLLVNSRTFYHTAKRHRDDHMVLQPVADLLNHAPRGCSVAFDARSFTILADRDYSPGDEIHICYGRHSNDFLLVEYGFVMAPGENDWDEACLDDVLLPRLSDAHRRRLEERGFLGKYMLDAETVCYRTQVALRTLVLPPRRWAQFVDGFADGEAEQPEVDELLREVLAAYDVEIGTRIETAGALDEGEEFQRQMVVARWKQIQGLVRATIRKLDT
ncbi:SET domain-containing protein [Colletotrichum higginsianum]|nr:SET domain-containing protein [Colletotrichum higginsianum]